MVQFDFSKNNRDTYQSKVSHNRLNQQNRERYAPCSLRYAERAIIRIALSLSSMLADRRVVY